MEAKARLNMDHGFMQSIIKIQVERDCYDKEVKAMSKQKISSVGASRAKKPDLGTYIPPTVRNQPNSTSNVVLFRLEFVEENGEISSLHIKKNDKVMMLAEEFGKSRNFTREMVLAFAEFLDQHIQRFLTKSEH